MSYIFQTSILVASEICLFSANNHAEQNLIKRPFFPDLMRSLNFVPYKVASEYIYISNDYFPLITCDWNHITWDPFVLPFLV